MRQTDTQYTQKYRAKRQTKRYAFDLYLDDPKELALAKMLDQAKAEKRLKTVIKDALLAKK